MKFLAEMRKTLRPSLEQRRAIKKEVEDIRARLKKTVGKQGTIKLGGSLAKDTGLAGKRTDIDIYICYRNKYDSREMSAHLQKALRKAFPAVKKLRGSRDYFQLKKNKVTIEFVPLKSIGKAEQADNITDVSPLHTKWVKKQLTAEQKDDVRLLKEFCQAHSIYGAESYIRGLSGYVCEILIQYYGSFLKCIRAITKKDSLFIDTERHYKSRVQAQREMNVAKLRGPMLVVDPVQKERNAASAVNEQSFKLLKKAAKAFLRKPSQHYFVVKEKSIASLKKVAKGKQRIVMKAKLNSQKKDIAAAKALKAMLYLEKKLKKESFAVKVDWYCNGEAVIWFEADDKKLPAYEIRKGPHVAMKKHATTFRKKHKGTVEKKNILYAKVPRKHRTLREALGFLIKEKNVQERLKHARII